ncbi:MAG: trypsin-like peptidase domain-containing protein [Anaerolineae bacterium]
MNNKKLLALFAGGGCLLFILIVATGFALLWFVPREISTVQEMVPTETPSARTEVTRQALPAPTWTPAPQEKEAPNEPDPPQQKGMNVTSSTLSTLYSRVNPGVVKIDVLVTRAGRTGQGSGSGFILDGDGHIVTNNHVVAQAERLIVTFHDGFQAEAEAVGRDRDSDLAVIRVDDLPANVSSLPLGDPEEVETGQWVVAVGSPFGLGSTMTLGIVSARGRTIPSGATPFSIPQAIQTDAAINPGNSGGPLLNLEGKVIGVNAQIASQTGTSAGVGFAIPSNVIRLVVPTLIERGEYIWPWLGVRGTGVDLILAKANDLEEQRGAYIVEVIDGGPAEEAGLQGSSRTERVDGQDVPVGGDIVVAIDGQAVENFDDLLINVASRQVDERVELTVLRDGQQRQITVELQSRPSEFQP